ncbi:actin-like protein Arp9p [[Candida] jaroonii]|uniref:Actin-like protein Arp9p n=1 Tax=[Candida] jaroonii TaxID=467808 RepID=A0ACA9Y4C4_9ASCO|nr:actin-like protein Arp9p [[Candida] jaroonii]
MPLYREENFLVIHPGSENTLFSFGLQESLSPPEYKIPSTIYKKDGEFQSKFEDGCETIKCIKGGKIIDLEGFKYLLKLILQSVIAQNPIVTINQIPLLIISPSKCWSKFQIEQITKYVIEDLEFSGFNILDLSIACGFGVGNGVSSLVVNLGKESMQISPVIGYSNIKFASKYIPKGSNLINEELKKLLPQYTDDQIEALKTSKIFEVMNSEENSFYSIADLNKVDEGMDEDSKYDIAKLVTDEVKPEEEDEKLNHELERNSFEFNGDKITVGKERFQGTGPLIDLIASEIYKVLLHIPDLEKRQECFDNLILVGSTFKIPGFKHNLLTTLSYNYLIRTPQQQQQQKEMGINSAIAAYQQSDDVVETTDGEFILSQVPNSIKLVKYPDYFPEWKKPKGGSWEDVYFLGGQIYAKQIFGGNSNANGELFVDGDNYEENGPEVIWSCTL